MSRVGRLCVVLLVLWIATFLLVRLVPGDPAARLAGIHANRQIIDALRHQLGLDQPVLTQFVRETGRLVEHGDLGRSFQTEEPVSTIIVERLPQTARLAGAGFLIVLVGGTLIGLAAGAVTQRGRKRGVELGFGVVTGAVGSMPEMVVGTLLVFVFALKLRLFPVAGLQGFSSLVLPSLAIAITPLALLARIVRAETVRVLEQDYVVTARSKRLPTRIIYFRHVLPNVLTAALTISGVIFAGLVGGVIVVENLFAWPGLGTVLVQAVLSLDYPVIQGTILFLGAVVVVVNAVIDFALVLINPQSTVSR